MKNIFLIICICLFINTLNAQSFTVSGYVKDTLSGETLIGATVYDLNTGKGTAVNEFGFYNLILEKGEVALQVSYVGYITKNKRFVLNQNTTLDVALDLKSLDEIVVTDKNIIAIPKERIGVNSLTIKQIENLPTLLGETDVLKALTMMPGISGGTEGTAGVVVRGGSPDQNLLLLDGATVYNNAHLFGFLSVFNPGAIKNVTLTKGGFPAEYGGRLSSVIDVSMKDGDMQKKHTEFSLGTISSWILTEGPIKKDTSSYMFSARTSWLGAFFLPLWINYKTSTEGEYYNYWMYDLNGKLNFKLSDKGRLYFSGFHGNDAFTTRTKETDYRYSYNTKWGNTQGNIRYTHIFQPKFFGNFTYHFNQYKYDIATEAFENSDSTNKPIVSLTNKSQIIDHTIKGRFDWLPNEKHHVRFGVEAKALYFKPNYITQTIEDVKTEGRNKPINATSAAVFMQDDYQIHEFLNLNVGLRYARYFTQGKAYNFFEPRLKLTFTQEKQAWQINYTQMNQALHLLTNNGGGLPTDLWVPATALTPPQNAQQFGVGYSRNFMKNQLEFTTEAYYKSFTNLIDYQNASISSFSTNDNWEDVIERDGIGEAYGLEFFLQKKQGKWNGWAGYTLSWNNRQFKNINDGEWFPYRYDRRHDFELTLNYQLNEDWRLATNFVYSTGIAVTLPEALQTPFFEGGRELTYIVTKRNNQRFPAYHRLDLSATKQFVTKRGNDAEFSFGMYNSYGKRNPFYMLFFVDIENFGMPNYTGAVRPVIYGESIFTFLPFVSYKVAF